MTPTVHKKSQQRKQRIRRRLQKRAIPELDRPMMTATNIHYELSDRGGKSSEAL